MKVALSEKDINTAIEAYVRENFGEGMGLVGIDFEVTRKPKGLRAEVEIAKLAVLDERKAERAILEKQAEEEAEAAKAAKVAQAPAAQEVPAPAEAVATEAAPTTDGSLFS